MLRCHTLHCYGYPVSAVPPFSRGLLRDSIYYMDMSVELGHEPHVELMCHSHNQTVKTCDILEMIFKSVAEGNEVSLELSTMAGHFQ